MFLLKKFYPRKVIKYNCCSEEVFKNKNKKNLTEKKKKVIVNFEYCQSPVCK